MKLNFNFIFNQGEDELIRRIAFSLPVIAALLSLSVLSTAADAPGSEAELRQALESLRAEVAALKASSPEKVAELERRIALLAAELEKLRTGGAAEGSTAPALGSRGFAPAASKVYRTVRGTSIGGYGEATYANFSGRRQDGVASDQRDRLDLLRAVVYVGHKFSDTILFNSEIEFEHASTGEGSEERGEVSIEQAYLDFKPWRNVGFRAGMVVAPLGFLNELHEPPIFNGARRNAVESLIIPSTWHEVGAGLFGDTGGVQWRVFALAGLASSGFTSEGIKEGRQQGSQSVAEDMAVAGRLDLTEVPGLLAGVSFYTANTGQGAAVDGRRIRGRFTLFDLHAQYEHRGLRLRALYVWSRLGDAALIDAQNGLGGDESVGERQYGGYLEAAYDVMTLRPAGPWSVVPFVRYERLNPQDRVPAGFEKDPSLDRRIWTAGIGVKPRADVVLKADYQWSSDRAKTGTNQLNLAVGYLF